MEKRVLLTAVLCFAVFTVWFKLFPSPVPPAATPQSTAALAPVQTGGGTPVPSTPPTAAQNTTIGKPNGNETRPPEERVTVVERPGLYRAEVTSYGAAIRSYELLHRRYYTHDLRRLVVPKGGTQIEVQRREMDGPTNLMGSYKPSLLVGFPNSGFAFPPEQVWTAIADETVPGQGRKLSYRWESPEVRVDKSLLFLNDSYQVAMTVQVKNLKSASVGQHFEVGIEGFQDPTQKPGSMFSARVPQNQVMWDRSGKMQSLSLENLQEKVPTDKLRGDLRWIGIGQQYFMLAAALQNGPQVGDKQGHAGAQANGAMYVSAEYSDRTIAPGETVEYKVTLYAGPKLPELLEGVSVDGAGAGLETSIDYTFGWLARPLLWILRQIYNLVGSWALAIVLLTILVKLVTLYPSHKSMRSMKAMAELKPEIDNLKLKCGDDKQRFNMELMSLYKKHGVNPLGGCLPMLIQMPIYFALYSMLGNAVDLYRVRFLWIMDLTAADPYFVLPLVTGGLMYLQTKFTPAPSDPQQKMMTLMMPFMFTAVSIFLPAGLTLYIMTNTVLGMLQQVVINRGKAGAASPSPAK